MTLFLIERPVDTRNHTEVSRHIGQFSQAAASTGGELIEIQVSRTLGRLYAVVEHQDGEALERSLKEQGIEFESLAQVRLVGADLDQVKASRGSAQYLVEWDFPSELTMEKYLARKKEKAPLYAQVPEVKFLRTYVREDMVKCLCLYDGPSIESIRRAREVVSTPIDRLSVLEDTSDRVV
jgi:hypothetical protein